MADYQTVGFHFKVDFFLDDLITDDIKFQEVSGLSVSLETEDFIEGGENRNIFSLPVRTTYADLELKRGIVSNSGITKWIQKGVRDFEFYPANLIITLMNESHQPLTTWNVVNAIPIEWTIGSLNAMESGILIESIKLKYHYFNMTNES